jgi:hypothetical protein
VVVGNAKSVLALYIAFQAKVLAVALSLILISNTCHSVGVQVGAANVAFTASAVTVNTSVVSQAGVGVAEEAIVLTLSVILLLVRVAVALFLVASLVLSTLPNQTSAFTIPVGVLITGDVRVLLVSVVVLSSNTYVPLASGLV